MSFMCDWLVMDIPYRHSELESSGFFMTQDYETGRGYRKEKFRLLEGSFEATTALETHFPSEAAVRAYRDLGCSNFTHLRLSGNPSKFLQGHNLFGSENVRVLAVKWICAVLVTAGLPINAFELKRWQDGDFWLSRVDVACMVDVGTKLHTREVMDALARQAHYARRKSVMDAGSLRWGDRKSHREVFKAYDKHVELQTKRGQLPANIPYRDQLSKWAEGKVRLEVELHATRLSELGLREGRAWTEETARQRYMEAHMKLSIQGQAVLSDSLERELPAGLRGTYALWQAGRDCKVVLPKPTFYRHRKALLAHGIDIMNSRDINHRPKVIDLHSVIRGIPATVPHWARGTDLLAA